MVEARSSARYSGKVWTHMRICAPMHLFLYVRFPRMASSVAAKIIRDFQSQLFATCGIDTIVLTAHKHESEQLITGMCINNLASPRPNIYDPSYLGISSINRRSMGQPLKNIAPTGRTLYYLGNGNSTLRSATSKVGNCDANYILHDIVL
jgi:hypothetical protein